MDSVTSPYPPWLRWLDWRLYAGRWFGVRVELHVLTILVPIVSFLMFRADGLPFGVSFGLSFLGAALLYLVIYTHEMGHVVAGWRFRIQTPLITLSPLGGLAHMQARAPSPKAEVLISAAGPLVNLLWIPVLLAVREFVPAPAYWWPYVIERLYQINVGLCLFNLLPFFPLDGGRIFRSLLAFRLHPNRATLIAARVGLVGAVLFIIAGFLTRDVWGFILVAIGIRSWQTCRLEMQMARFEPSPYGTALATWESDPDAWKHGPARDSRSRARRPGFFARRRAERNARKVAREREEAARLQEDVDRILAKINDVGMSGITEDERATLLKASRSMRGSGR